MSDNIINRVANSQLLTLDLADYLPKEEIVIFDLKSLLFMEMVLKEKDFRANLEKIDWTQYRGKTVTITCSNDAIIPAWAFMLVVSYLQPLAKKILLGDLASATKELLLQNIRNADAGAFRDLRVVIKGCGDDEIDPAAYAEITIKLQPVAKSIMYGEPCSTVPVFKKRG